VNSLSMQKKGGSNPPGCCWRSCRAQWRVVKLWTYTMIWCLTWRKHSTGFLQMLSNSIPGLSSTFQALGYLFGSRTTIRDRTYQTISLSYKFKLKKGKWMNKVFEPLCFISISLFIHLHFLIQHMQNLQRLWEN